MKRTVPVLFLVAVVSAAASAQPQWPRYGDPVVAVAGSAGNYTAYLDLKSPTKLHTLFQARTNHVHFWLRMAADNSDLVVSEVDRAKNPNPGFLLNVRRGAQQAQVTTLIALGNAISDGFELDHDGWIACGRTLPTPSPQPNYLLHVAHGPPPTLTTLRTLPLTVQFNEIAIDRDPGQTEPYVIGTCCPTVIGPNPAVLRADRRHTITTVLVPQNPFFGYFSGIEVHPRSGDLLFAEINIGIIRMDRVCSSLSRNTLLAGPMTAARIAQDDSMWIAANQQERIFKYDLSRNAVVSIYPLGLPPGQALQSIDLYGSRSIVCWKVSASTVNLRVQSRHPQAGSAQYALAAGLARRPGIRMPNRQWLDLDVTHPLFYASALGLLPSIFQNFRGRLDPLGNAPARVTIPPPPVQGSGITIFVAGVIFNTQGVIEVTNTHWFVL